MMKDHFGFVLAFAAKVLKSPSATPAIVKVISSCTGAKRCLWNGLQASFVVRITCLTPLASSDKEYVDLIKTLETSP